MASTVIRGRWQRADVNPFGHLGLPVAEELNAEQSAGRGVAGEAHGDAVASGVVRLVVVGLGSTVSGSNPPAMASWSRRPVRATA